MDQAEYVIGVDTHKDRHAAALVSRSHGVTLELEVAATPRGYARLVDAVSNHAPARRLWAVEGSGSYGAGLTRYLQGLGEQVVEISRPRRDSPSHAKNDALDALRAAHAGLRLRRPATPRMQHGQREALRVLLAARRSAITARRIAQQQLRALLITAPDELRQQLAPLKRDRLITRCAALRLPRQAPRELRATILALRSCARRAKLLETEANALRGELIACIHELAPHLLEEPGIGPISAAQILASWSHPGRVRSEAAFARLAAAAPIPASSGSITRYRLDPGGDRQLNYALHTILINRRRIHPPTRAYLARRAAHGKTTKEATRCLKRFLARRLYRLLESPPLAP